MEFNIRLRAFEKEDALFINQLRNEDEREKYIGGSKRYVSLCREQKWVEDIILGDSQSVMYFAVTTSESDSIIGYTSISDIDYRNGSCFWSGIKLSPSVAGKGYGLQVGLLVLNHVFEEMRMVRCTAQAQEGHQPAIRMLDKLGFFKEGLMRKNVFKNGNSLNTWLLSIIEEEYKLIKSTYNL
ncbi:GNAT family N-acetyltransferase [Myroides sp. M-43]|uniref:GNAT family N-acetyltransferase n=1 Tax=Myroides oncorhynchi TaxID=2893756 RepID=UPI001E486192|nr:GNAT family protein [Myroides oncorhynchi]MCC9043491.1 GNAT family N-acetyltransferase [Myroides oncorhynchi]